MIVAFTGHRPEKLGGYGQMPGAITDQILLKLASIPDKKLLVITGMALGIDQHAAKVCIELSLPFLAAVPFVGQEKRWPTDSQEHYWYLLSKAARIVVTGEIQKASIPKLLQQRNEWMVDNCDLLIAVWDGSKGGTANCVHYAKLVGRPIHLIDKW